MTSDPSKVIMEGVIKNYWYNHFQYEWNIKDLNFLEYGRIDSPVFQVKLDDDITQWKIRLCRSIIILNPPLRTESNVDNVDISLELVHTKLSNLVVNCKFIFVNSYGKKIKCGSFTNYEFRKSHSAKGCCDFIPGKILFDEISHGYNPRIISKIVVSNSLNPIPQIMPLIHSLKTMKDGFFSDITISVKNREFKAHKAILAARSAVFSAMFQNEMKEAKSNKVEIEDISPEVFEEFLEYVYTGDTEIIGDNVRELLAAADKYDVEGLKNFCEDALIENLSHENCFKTLILADLHSAKKLKKQTIDFIVSTGPELDQETREMRLSEINDTSLLKELIGALMDKIQIAPK